MDPEALPRPSDRRLAVRLTADALRHVRRGHPWVFDASIVSVSHEGAPGDLAVVFDADRRFAAIGLYDPASPIRLRILHQGRPVTIDATWWRRRIAEAVARRAPLAEDPGTTAYRCVHGENDGLPGLVVDRYDRTVVLALHSAALLPHLPVLVAAIADVLDPERVVLRFARTVTRGDTFGLVDGEVLAGSVPEGPIPFLEHGLAFDADVQHGQKTGAFLDQRDNRALVGEASAGARVLDVFCCSGGFSVHAAAGGARLVHAVDRSPAAIETTRRALERNRDRPAVAACEVRTTVGDAFAELEALRAQGARFDVVVVDPPSFAHKQADVPGALQAYGSLTRLALGVLRPDGLLVQASCSSRVSADAFTAAVEGAARAARRPLDVVRRTGQPIDHPVGFPEGAYLKAVFARVPG